LAGVEVWAHRDDNSPTNTKRVNAVISMQRLIKTPYIESKEMLYFKSKAALCLPNAGVAK
jgi:hypothetical protein